MDREQKERQGSTFWKATGECTRFAILIRSAIYSSTFDEIYTLNCLSPLNKMSTWSQIPQLYWSLLLISGSFECREVFLSQIWAVSWPSIGGSDTPKKSEAFPGSQKWTFGSQQSKVNFQKPSVKTGLASVVKSGYHCVKHGGATSAWGGSGRVEQKNEGFGWSRSACHEDNKVDGKHLVKKKTKMSFSYRFWLFKESVTSLGHLSCFWSPPQQSPYPWLSSCGLHFPLSFFFWGENATIRKRGGRICIRPAPPWGRVGECEESGKRERKDGECSGSYSRTWSSSPSPHYQVY